MQMYAVRHKTDGYFAGIVMASSEDEARAIAWKNFKESREDTWQEYGQNESEIQIRDLGFEYFGADGEGHLEMEW